MLNYRGKVLIPEKEQEILQCVDEDWPNARIPKSALFELVTVYGELTTYTHKFSAAS